ncbi:hypothetical protein [Haematobacter massiliensis]|uniref:hypothetical protein n=1 Tax=Haematobacter massiliensis TaxID=195105 RepID=UPI0020CEB640|nr:hypothetical protein [Haematobacter massiliensis]
MTDADMLTALQSAEQETGWRTPSLLVDLVVQKLDPTNAAEEAHFRAQAERVLHARNTCWGAG